jgi:protein-disulfide isomerase
VIAGIVLLGLLIVANRPSDTLALTPPSDPTPTELADRRAVGQADAPATLEVWADFQCPSCGVFARSAEARLIRDYVADGQLRIVFRDFAFIGEESTAAAVAARAAEAQGQFWPFHDWLFANQDGENKGGFRREVLVGIASEIGLDVSAFETALDDAALADAVEAETASGSQVPVSATPTLVLGEQTWTGIPAWEELSAAVEAEIAKASGGQTAP